MADRTLFQLKDLFENVFLCLQRFELLCCMTTSCNTKRVFCGLGPPMGDKSFVIKKADCFPKIAKNTHTLGGV